MSQTRSVSQAGRIFAHSAANPRYKMPPQRKNAAPIEETPISDVRDNSDMRANPIRSAEEIHLQHVIAQGEEILERMKRDAAKLVLERSTSVTPMAYTTQLLIAHAENLHQSNPEELRFWKGETDRQSEAIRLFTAENHALTEQLCNLQESSGIGSLFTAVADELEESKDLCVNYLDSIERQASKKKGLGAKETLKLLSTVRAVMDRLEDYITQARSFSGI